MDEKTLKRLLRAEDDEMGSERLSGAFLPSGRIPLRRHSCPDEATLPAYVDHRIPDDKRERLESHLADCEACLGQVAFLARQPADLAGPVVPGAVARARDLVAPASRRWRPLVLRWGSAAAAVACVVLVVVAVFRPGWTPQTPAAVPVSDAVSAVPAQPVAEQRTPSPLGTARGDPERAKRVEGPPAASRQPRPLSTVRKSAPAATAPLVAAPVDNATVARRNLEFRWQPVPGSLYYEINVVTEEGTVVWQTRVEGTKTRPPGDVTLETGAKYFIWVKAFLTGGETVRSAAVSFHVAGQ